MTKFPSRAAYTTIDLAIKNDSGAYSISNQHENEITRVSNLRPTKPKFGKGYGICIIVDGHGQTGRARNYFANRQVPPLEVRNEYQTPGGRIDQSGNTDANSFDRAFPSELPDNLDDMGQCVIRIRIGRKCFLLHHESS